MDKGREEAVTVRCPDRDKCKNENCMHYEAHEPFYITPTERCNEVIDRCLWRTGRCVIIQLDDAPVKLEQELVTA